MQNPTRDPVVRGSRRAWLPGLLVPACAIALGCTGQIDSGRSRPSATGSSGQGGGAGQGGGLAGDIGQTVPPDSSGWYGALTAANCSSAPAALPQSRIWRLTARQWKNTVEQAFKITGLDV